MYTQQNLLIIKSKSTVMSLFRELYYILNYLCSITDAITCMQHVTGQGGDHFNYFFFFFLLLGSNFSPVSMFQAYSKRTYAHCTNIYVYTTIQHLTTFPDS